MFPFVKNIRGFFHKPRYRLMASRTYSNRYFLWDRIDKRAYKDSYFDNLDEAMSYIEINNIDCDQYDFFKDMP